MIAMKRTDLAAGLAEVTAYIRSHLDQPIALADLAGQAGFSPYHFHRVFRAIIGEPLAAYVRRERLQRAALRLRESGRDVTAIALEAGYDSPSAFTRAFAEHFGVPPTEFRADDALPVVPPHALPNFRSREMELRIEELRPRRLIAVPRTGTYRITAPQAWAALRNLAVEYGLFDGDAPPIGLSYDNPEYCEESELRYEACISTGAPPPGESYRVEFAGGRHAVYRHTGPYVLIEHVFDRLFDAVVLSGAHELREAPCVELYLNDPTTADPAEYVTDVCIPIV
jgi:AraC family transcriptional regulator